MPHRNDLNLDSNHNTAIRAEIGDQLRVLLSKEQATEAENQARQAKNEIVREAWLRVSQGWHGLLRKRPQGDDESPK